MAAKIPKAPKNSASSSPAKRYRNGTTKLRGFNANDYENPSFKPLPKGCYLLSIKTSEMRPTKNGDGVGIHLELQVMDGRYKGRTFYHWINYEHPSERTQRIGRETLAMICRAVGVLQPKDTVDLHEIPFFAMVEVKPAHNGYDAGNTITKASRDPCDTPNELPPWASGGEPLSLFP